MPTRSMRRQVAEGSIGARGTAPEVIANAAADALLSFQFQDEDDMPVRHFHALLYACFARLHAHFVMLRV